MWVLPLLLVTAGNLPCREIEPDSVTIDGMLDDWEGIPGARGGGKDKDQSFELRCATDDDTLYLVVDARDDRLVRLFKAKGKLQDAEDHLEVTLPGVSLRLWPGTERNGPRRQQLQKKKWKALPKWLKVEDTQQPKGWSVEIALPLAKVGWTEDTAELAAAITFVDADDTEVHTSERLAQDFTLGFGAAPTTDVFAQFLKDAKLKKGDVVIDASLGEGMRLVGGKSIIGLVGKSYSYIHLPGDASKMQLVDLRGDGKKQVLVVLRQSGGGGSRDLVAVFAPEDGKVEQLFAVEIRKEADGNLLESTWKLQKKKKGKGQELVVEAGTAVGWDEDTFEEDQAEDAETIHLPWDDDRRGGVYWLDGDTLRSKVLKKGR
jgi:hypothetical protein